MNDAHTVRHAARRLVLTAVAFACLLVTSRAITKGLVGSVFDLGAGSAPQFAAAVSESRLVALCIAMALGCARRRLISRPVLGAAGIALFLAAFLLALGVPPALQMPLALLMGVASGVCMLALMLVMSDESFKIIVIAGVAGAVLGAAAIGALPVLPQPLCGMLVALLGAACASALAFADPTAECFADHGTFSRDEFSRFPWFASVMVVACGVLGTILYAASDALSWGVMGGPAAPVMGAAALVVVALTLAAILVVDNWTQVVWVPLFVLLACALACVCTNASMLGGFELGLLYAIVLAFHFLRWVVFPAVVSTSLLPRYFTSGLFLVVTSGALSINAAAPVFDLVPAGLQVPASFGGIVALLLAVVLALVLLVDRMGQDAEYEEPAGAAALGATDAEQGVEAFDRVGACCDSLSSEFGLTAREHEICGLTARGHSSTYIAEQLVISPSTVRFHQQNLYRKLDVHSKQELITFVESRSAQTVNSVGSTKPQVKH